MHVGASGSTDAIVVGGPQCATSRFGDLSRRCVALLDPAPGSPHLTTATASTSRPVATHPQTLASGCGFVQLRRIARYRLRDKLSTSLTY
jgi:hypothetical protein